MAHPKRRNSKARTAKRRAHDFLKEPKLALCSNCQSPVLYHRVCKECGYYRGKQVIEAKEA
ncbi:MAG: 50S ribosomal protein L32 [Bacteroidales bacterium]|jgi:large subunit ribosomal protein L32